MIYISDIFINLHYDFFEFYEWNKKDHIEHIKKIPIIKVNNKTLFDIINYKINLDQPFIQKYINKCEKYNSSNNFNYIAFTNGINSLVISFDKNGNIIKKSSLIFEDEENICLLSKNAKYIKLIYKIIKKYNYSNHTRFEKERIHYLIKKIKRISENQLKYLYYDCFNKQESNINIIINKISNELKNDNLDVYNKSDSLFNLINK